MRRGQEAEPAVADTYPGFMGHLLDSGQHRAQSDTESSERSLHCREMAGPDGRSLSFKESGGRVRTQQCSPRLLP
jgi:hypothetical protein